MSDLHDWIEHLPAAVTVADAQGIIRLMNQRARDTFASSGGEQLIGKSLHDCHPPAAQEQIKQMLQTGAPNHYTIQKRGVKKIIHQIPLMADGKVEGIVEISVPIPADMPHFDRDMPPA